MKLYYLITHIYFKRLIPWIKLGTIMKLFYTLLYLNLFVKGQNKCLTIDNIKKSYTESLEQNTTLCTLRQTDCEQCLFKINDIKTYHTFSRYNDNSYDQLKTPFEVLNVVTSFSVGIKNPIFSTLRQTALRFKAEPIFSSLRQTAFRTIQLKHLMDNTQLTKSSNFQFLYIF